MITDFNINSKTLLLVTKEDLRDVLLDIINSNNSKAEKEGKQEDRILTRKEAAKMLSVDISTLWRWEREGHLLPSRIGKRIYYKYSEIQRITER